MTNTPQPSPFDGWIPLTEYARVEGLALGTAQMRAFRALSGRKEDPTYEFLRVAPQARRSTVLAKKRQHPDPHQ